MLLFQAWFTIFPREKKNNSEFPCILKQLLDSYEILGVYFSLFFYPLVKNTFYASHIILFKKICPLSPT